MPPLISVIMPVYNCENYLNEAIDSILNQTFKDFEFLIFNDGSTDHSAEIIESYEDKRIRFFNYTDNKGLSTRLNQGIIEAKGKYIARMDSDDVSLNNRFTKQFEFLEANTDISLCGTFIELFGNPNKNFNWVKETDPDFIKINLLFDCAICHPSVMFKRHEFNKLKFLYNSEMEPCEDYDMWIRMSKKAKLANIDSILLKYRLNNDQVSNKNNELQRKYKLEIIKSQLSKLNIIPNSIELRIHDHIFFSAVIVSADYLIKVRNWLKKLKESNKIYQVYHEEKFSKYLESLLKDNEEQFIHEVKKLKLTKLISYYAKRIINWKSIT